MKLSQETNNLIIAGLSEFSLFISISPVRDKIIQSRFALSKVIFIIKEV